VVSSKHRLRAQDRRGDAQNDSRSAAESDDGTPMRIAVCTVLGSVVAITLAACHTGPPATAAAAAPSKQSQCPEDLKLSGDGPLRWLSCIELNMADEPERCAPEAIAVDGDVVLVAKSEGRRVATAPLFDNLPVGAGYELGADGNVQMRPSPLPGPVRIHGQYRRVFDMAQLEPDSGVIYGRPAARERVYARATGALLREDTLPFMPEGGNGLYASNVRVLANADATRIVRFHRRDVYTLVARDDLGRILWESSPLGVGHPHALATDPLGTTAVANLQGEVVFVDPLGQVSQSFSMPRPVRRMVSIGPGRFLSAGDGPAEAKGTLHLMWFGDRGGVLGVRDLPHGFSNVFDVDAMGRVAFVGWDADVQGTFVAFVGPTRKWVHRITAPIRGLLWRTVALTPDGGVVVAGGLFLRRPRDRGWSVAARFGP
jgi:hypothetical protein